MNPNIEFSRSHFSQVLKVNYSLFELDKKGMREPNENELHNLETLDKIEALLEYILQNPFKSLFTDIDINVDFYKIFRDKVIKRIIEKLSVLSDMDNISENQANILFYNDLDIYYVYIMEECLGNKKFKKFFECAHDDLMEYYVNIPIDYTYEQIQEMLSDD